MTETTKTAASSNASSSRKVQATGGWEADQAKKTAQLANMARLRALRLARDNAAVAAEPLVRPSKRRKP